MKKLFFLTTLIFLTATLFLIKKPFAQESTFSAEGDDKSKEIEQIKKSVQQIVEEKLEQVISEQKKVGWLGTIINKDSSTITLENNNNEREILFSDETVIVDLKSQKLKLEDLAEGKKVVALGYQQAENIMEAKRVILVNETETNKLPLLGTISDKSQVENLIVITPANDKDQTLEIMIGPKTEIVNENDEEIGYDKLEKGQRVGVVYETGEATNSALLIRIMSAPENN